MKNYLIILFSTFSILTYSQSGVSGLVMDGDYNEPLAFSNVLIKGTTKGTIKGIIKGATKGIVKRNYFKNQ